MPNTYIRSRSFVELLSKYTCSPLIIRKLVRGTQF